MSDENYRNASVSSQLMVCAVVLAMPLFYAAILVALRVGGILPVTGFGEIEGLEAQTLAYIFLAAGVGTSLASIFFKKLMIQTVSGPVDANRRFQTVLVAMAIAESGALLGFVFVLLTGQVIYGALLGALSFAVSCFHFPSRRWLLEGDG